MSVNFQTISTELQMMTQQEKNFEVQRTNQDKVEKAKRELKKTLNISSSHKDVSESKNGKPLVSPVLAFILAVKDSTDDRLNNMAAHVEHMQQFDAEVGRVQNMLLSLDQQEDGVSSLSTDDMNSQIAILNAKLTMANNQVSSLAQNETQEATYMNQDAANNSADSNKAKMMIQIIVDNEGNYGKR